MKTVYGLIITILIFTCNIHSQAISSAKDLSDLQNDLLNVFISNKNLTIQDLFPKLHNQTEASVQSIKRNSEKLPTKDEIIKAVSEIISKLPNSNTMFVGNGIQRFQEGLTRHLMMSFGLSTSK